MTDAPADAAIPFDDDDGFEITPTGLTHLRLDAVDYWLRRPKIGQMRAIEEAFVAASNGQVSIVQDLAAATAAATTEDAIDADPEAAVDAVTDAAKQAQESAEQILHAVFEAWRFAVATLERTGQTLPADDDDMPPWLGNFATSNAMRTGWRRIPWLAAPPK